MSWLLGKAEDLLNKVDQAAGQTLSTTGEQDDNAQLTNVVTDQHGGSIGGPPPTTNLNRHASVPNVKINTGSSSYLSQTSKSVYAPSKTATPTTIQTAVVSSGNGSMNTAKSKRDKDEELFEFLNAPDSDSNGSANGMKRKPSQTNLSRHSRTSSASSTFSNKSGKVTEGRSSTTEGTVDIEVEGTMEQSLGEDVAIELLTKSGDTSSGYHSSHDEIHGNHEHISSLELENNMLKNEITSLNQEMASVIERAKSSQEELQKVKRKLELQNQQLSKSDQIVRELQAREIDTAESVKAKDAQIGVLRVRFEEADKENKAKDKQLQNITAEKERVLQDHNSSSGMQSHALDSLKEKLYEAEENLRKEREKTHIIQQEAQERQRKLESEQQSLSEAMSLAQKKYTDEKVRTSELNTQLKTSKSQMDIAKQELTDYKEKASRILQSKDKLISSLKDGSGGSGGIDSTISVAELESAKQEIQMLKEEVQHGRLTAENLRSEIQDLEVQMQQDSENSLEQIQSLEEQLKSERVGRQDAETEVSRQKEELRYAHEELLKQKTGFQSRLQDRESEIERLRNQITNRSNSSSSQVELENRLHSLTESLIQKQTVMEALSTEKNSLTLQLERLERKYKDLEMTASQSLTTTVHMSDEDDVRNQYNRVIIPARQRMPGFLKESPTDTEIARRVKRVYSSVDKFSIRLGVFLRRYPIARVFMFGYMALLHLWVMIVLLTYQPELHAPGYHPEIHGQDFQPMPPGPNPAKL